jgi:hypothetical protein
MKDCKSHVSGTLLSASTYTVKMVVKNMYVYATRHLENKKKQNILSEETN